MFNLNHESQNIVMIKTIVFETLDNKHKKLDAILKQES